MNVNNRQMNNLITALALMSLHTTPMNINNPHKRKRGSPGVRRRSPNGRGSAKRAKH
jgi:hypothetical protein